MKIKQGSLNLNHLKVKVLIIKVLFSFVIIGFVFISENKVFGQGVVDIFSCIPFTANAGNSCTHTVVNSGTATARADFHCSNWTSTERAWVTSTSGYSCTNGVPVTNVARVSDRDTYVDGFVQADGTYGPVVRTVTSFALFCNRAVTPLLTQSYSEGCDRRRRNDGGGCLSGMTIYGEKFKDDDSADICSSCNPDQSEIEACEMGGGATWDWAVNADIHQL